MEHIVHIDKSGRIVIPKLLRDALGFLTDTPLALAAEGGNLTVKPAKETGRIKMKNGIPVWSSGGARISHEEVNAALEASRERHE